MVKEELKIYLKSTQARLNEIQVTGFKETKEAIRTVSLLTSVLERVRQYLTGECNPRFFAAITTDEQCEEILNKNNLFIDRLERENYPFKGRYCEFGGSVVDHCVVKKGDLYHLFYIRVRAGFAWTEVPMRDFGHAVSTDLKEWYPLQPALESGKSGFDCYQVWAPHIVEKDGLYYMFYTGVNENAAQTVGLATSSDLYHWTKYEKNPLLHTSEWGYWGADHWSDGRDPMVMEDDSKYYMYYTRSRFDEKRGRYISCVGVSSSENLIEWKDEGTIDIGDDPDYPPESPFMVKRDGKYFLFYTQYFVGTCCWVSDQPIRGFQRQDWSIILQDVSASEIVQTETGEYYISRITHESTDMHFIDFLPLYYKDGKFFTK